MPLDEADTLVKLGNSRRAYVLPDLKILYVSSSKNACTSIKWLLAELNGEDLDEFRAQAGGRTPIESIHHRELWQKTPKLNGISSALRADIHPDNGWYVFGVTRDPRVRMFSAWQNKFLLRSPHYSQWLEEPWSPRIPFAQDDVIEDFATFVGTLAVNPDHPVFRDPHFGSQVNSLREDCVSYSRIYDVSDLAVMQQDLAAHLRSVGHDVEFVLGHSNDTPLAANGRVFDNGVREQVEKIYSADFERFGDRWDFSRIEAREMNWDASSLSEVRDVIEGNNRVAAIRNDVIRLTADKRQLRQQVRKLERKVGRQRVRIKRLKEAKPGSNRTRRTRKAGSDG